MQDKIQDNVKEQTERSVSKIGKFNTADDLLKAYNALQSEFTKRCQLVKQLQTELDSLRAQAGMPSEVSNASEQIDGQTPVEQSPVVAPADRAEEQTAVASVDTEKISADGAEKSENDDKDAIRYVLDEVAAHTAFYAELLSAIPEIMDACIVRYKRRLIESPSVCSPSGMAVIVPAKRPRSLDEAKRLADSMLSGKY